MSDVSIIDLDAAADPEPEAPEETGETTEPEVDNRWAVTLHMRFPEQDAATPIAAVDKFLDETMKRGLRNLVYAVRDLTDEDGATVFVESGIAYTDVEFEERLRVLEFGEEDDEDDEDPDDGGA